jgi:hypothetical protein
MLRALARALIAATTPKTMATRMYIDMAISPSLYSTRTAHA